MTHELEASQDAGLIRRLYKNMRKVRCKSPHAEGKCWESTYNAGNGLGYRQIGYRNGHRRLMISVHRLSWAYHNQQEIPGDMLICHHCDNPSCINPDHLFLGTSGDNSQDSVEKGRSSRVGARGESHYNASLDWHIIAWIRLNCNRKFLGVRVTQAKLSDRVNKKWNVSVSASHIGRIIRNNIWQDPNWNPKTRQYIDPENIRS